VIVYNGTDESNGKITGLNIFSIRTDFNGKITEYSPFVNKGFNQTYKEYFDIEALTDTILYIVSHKVGIIFRYDEGG